jgi:hypothetical protein
MLGDTKPMGHQAWQRDPFQGSGGLIRLTRQPAAMQSSRFEVQHDLGAMRQCIQVGDLHSAYSSRCSQVCDEGSEDRRDSRVQPLDSQIDADLPMARLPEIRRAEWRSLLVLGHNLQDLGGVCGCARNDADAIERRAREIRLQLRSDPAWV